MSYSRWGGRGSGQWYTFWCASLETKKEDRDNAIFSICAVTSFTAKELRDDIDSCIKKVKDICENCSTDELEELKIYMNEFLEDVDAKYPESKS